jgi:hypothetical protein
MRHPDTATPAPAAAGNRRHDVRFGGLDIPRNTPSDIAPQQDLAARIVAARYGLAPHLAELVVHLAGLGGRP